MSHAYLCGSALRVALELRNSQPQSVLRFCVLSGQKFFCVRSSLWRRFARCVARSVIVVAGKFASILICGLDYSSCVTHSHNPFCVFAFLVVRDFFGLTFRGQHSATHSHNPFCVFACLVVRDFWFGVPESPCTPDQISRFEIAARQRGRRQPHVSPCIHLF